MTCVQSRQLPVYTRAICLCWCPFKAHPSPQVQSYAFMVCGCITCTAYLHLLQVVDPIKASYGVDNAIYAVGQLAQTTMRRCGVTRTATLQRMLTAVASVLASAVCSWHTCPKAGRQASALCPDCLTLTAVVARFTRITRAFSAPLPFHMHHHHQLGMCSFPCPFPSCVFVCVPPSVSWVK